MTFCTRSWVARLMRGLSFSTIVVVEVRPATNSERAFESLLRTGSTEDVKFAVIV